MEPALNRFFDTLPSKPHATDDFNDGVYRQRKSRAVTCRYIQPNRNGTIHYLAFDIDHDDAYWAYDNALLPPPTIITLNRDNGRGHLLYELAAAVTVCDEYPKPKAYADAIRVAYSRKLAADTSYTGFTTKNPLAKHWRVKTNHGAVYSLTELAEHVVLPRVTRRQSTDIAYLGRNCELFERCRAWAYRAFNRSKSQSHFDAGVFEFCTQYNAVNFAANPLPEREVRSVARSVAKWVWRKFSPAQFSDIQRARTLRGAEKRRNQTEQRIRDAIAEFRNCGKPVMQRAIARHLGLHHDTMRRYRGLFQ